MTCVDFKDLPRRTASGSVLCDKAFQSASNPKYDGQQCRLASVINKFVDKKPGQTGTGISENQKLASEIGPSLESLKRARYTRLTKIIFEILILQTCNH